ncbi:MAG: chemotaxis protein CheA [Nitrospirota bacterium]|nr:chemotaxis protein CheA [Nitrospirota bacterium]
MSEEEKKERFDGGDSMDFSVFLGDFLRDAQEGFQEAGTALLALEKDHGRREALDDVFRVVHTIKSSSTMLEFADIAGFAHTLEDLLGRMRDKTAPVDRTAIDILFDAIGLLEALVVARAEKRAEPAESVLQKVRELKDRILARDTGTVPQDRPLGPEKPAAAAPQIEAIRSVRVRVDVLDSLFNLVGELIIIKNRIDNLVADVPGKELKAALSAMDHMIATLQDDVSAARMVPVDEIVQKFPRMMRTLARERGKEVDFVIEGREIELDKSILDALGEPLLHLLRNAVDHGVDPPEERRKLGKPGTAAVTLSVMRTENNILVSVEDDGAGIDISRMRELAAARGYVKPAEAERMQERDVLNLLFQPGVSSTEQVTSLSGRGVGLDVVKTSVRKMGGTVDIATRKGAGSRFTLTLPLTTSIIQTLLVGVGAHTFAIPSDMVLESLEIKPEDVKDVGARQALVLRREAIPFVRLHEALNIPAEEGRRDAFAVIIKQRDSFVAVGVDAVQNHAENIIKPFDPVARQFKGFSGGIIMGDGSVALLLDMPTLLGFDTLREETLT